ncbi:hypothetical protein SELMODRAFT_407053 [Selaginella moellendorffii]|uniref:Uncharacterized protein n=1 Tax=Selaginella moellendorffii TaxID=88036 RepID=D8R3S1_SELML|nr:hypothetical protein SELMODRAFT_407053 [Selaginella moellendorffii]
MACECGLIAMTKSGRSQYTRFIYFVICRDKYAILYAITDDMDRFSEEIRTHRSTEEKFNEFGDRFIVFTSREALDRVREDGLIMVRTDPEIPVNAFYAKKYLNIRWQLVSCKHGFQSQQLVSCAPLPTEKSYLSIYADEFSSKLSRISTRAEPVISFLLSICNLDYTVFVFRRDEGRFKCCFPISVMPFYKLYDNIEMIIEKTKPCLQEGTAPETIPKTKVFTENGLAQDYAKDCHGTQKRCPTCSHSSRKDNHGNIQLGYLLIILVCKTEPECAFLSARGNSLLSTFEASKIGKDRQLTGWRRVGVFDRFKEV